MAVCCADPALEELICDALVAGGHSVQTRQQNVRGLLAARNGSPPACIVAAVEAPARDLVGSVQAIRPTLGAPALVLVCRRARGPEVRRALKLGVDGVLLEAEIETALAAVVEVVCAGQVSVPSRRRPDVTVRALTTREKQILALVVVGLTNTQIAGRLYLAESTVKSHLSSAFSKLGVSSRYEASAMILDRDQGAGLGVREIELSQLGELAGAGVQTAVRPRGTSDNPQSGGWLNDRITSSG